MRQKHISPSSHPSRAVLISHLSLENAKVRPQIAMCNKTPYVTGTYLMTSAIQDTREYPAGRRRFAMRCATKDLALCLIGRELLSASDWPGNTKEGVWCTSLPSLPQVDNTGTNTRKIMPSAARAASSCMSPVPEYLPMIEQAFLSTINGRGPRFLLWY